MNFCCSFQPNVINTYTRTIQSPFAYLIKIITKYSIIFSVQSNSEERKMDVGLFNVPHEIYHYIVRYMDLIDFGSLMLSCKKAVEVLGMDLQLQKLAFENTPRKILHSISKMPIRALFAENLALIALKSNDIETMKFSMPSMQYRSILQKIKPMRDKIGSAPVKRQQFLLEVFKYDADKVLKHLIDICLAELKHDKNGVKNIIGILSLLGEAIFSLSTEKEATATRSISYVLSVFKQFEAEVLISLVYVSSIQDSFWGISEVPCVDFIKRLRYYQKKFPEYIYDLDLGIPAHLYSDKMNHSMVKVLINEPVTPLEFAAYLGSQKTFDLLLEHGATFNPKFPYLAIVFHRFTCTQEKFIDRLIELGADINRPLPKFLDDLQRDILRYFMQNPNLDNIILLEIVLSLGAKTVVTDSEREELIGAKLWTNPLVNFALKAQMTDYKPFKPAQLTIDGTPYASRLFKSSRWTRPLKIYANGGFEMNNELIGAWKIVDGKLVCLAKKRRATYTRGGSGGSYTSEIEITPKTFTFIVFELFTGELAITEDIPGKSVFQMLVDMLWEEKVTNTMYYHG